MWPIFVFCFILRKNCLVCRFYLHWGLDQDDLALIFSFRKVNSPAWNCSQLRINWIDYLLIYIYIYIYHHHHHHCVVSLARISLTLSRHFSLSFIASSRSSGLHPVSSHSCCMDVRAGRPALAPPYVRAHRSTSLMSSSLLLQQCPACLVCLTWIVFVTGGRWRYIWSFVGCCCQDLYIYIYIYIYIY